MKPTLMSIKARYCQSPDGNDHGVGDQILNLEMMHCGAGPYLVITTERWATAHPKDLYRLVRDFAAQVEYLFDANQGV